MSNSIDLTCLVSLEDRPALIDESGHMYWYEDGKISRSNGKPAIVRCNGDKEYYVGGLRHREHDKPAIVRYRRFRDRVAKHREWYHLGLCHREGDRPAVIEDTGRQKWFYQGLQHRVGKPAEFFDNGTVYVEAWFENGLAHRDGAPAMISRSPSYTSEVWYQKGFRHREGDEPAVIETSIYSTGETRTSRSWIKMGKLHRLGNPAVIVLDHNQVVQESYYVDGLYHRDDDQPAFVSQFQKMWYHRGELHRENDKPANILYDRNGKIMGESYYRHNLLHREGDLPAHIADDKHEYAIDGKNHREGGKPAIIYFEREGRITGCKYYVDGLEHRDDDLPAVDLQHHKEWHYRGLKHRAGGKPAVITLGCIIQFWINGKLECDFGPAITYVQPNHPYVQIFDRPYISSSNKIEYYQNGLKHRIGEPAAIHPNGGKEWMVEGIRHRCLIIDDEENNSSDESYAVISYSCVKSWFLRGKLYRSSDLPTIVDDRGNQYWCEDHQCSNWYRIYGNFRQDREYNMITKDGEKRNYFGRVEFYVDSSSSGFSINAKLYSRGDFPSLVTVQGKQIWHVGNRIRRQGDRPVIITASGKQIYCDRKGRIHRSHDRPAIVYKDGSEEYYRHGKLHREGDEPAVIKKHVRKFMIDGKCHRDNDQPAVIRMVEENKNYPSGEILEWFIDGVRKRIDPEQPHVINTCVREMRWYGTNNKIQKTEPLVGNRTKSAKVIY